MNLPEVWDSYNTDLDEMENKFALAFINRRPDEKTVATMAPIGTNIRYAPKTAPRNEGFSEFFHNSCEPTFETSLDMGFAFADYDMDAQFAGSSTALKKLFMEPFRAGPLSLFCHRVGKTIYVDMDNHITDESFKEEVQSLSEEEHHLPSYSTSHSMRPGLTLYENLIWNCKEASEVWRENMGICRTTELALDVPKNSLIPMFDSYSYKIQPQHSLNGEAYIWEFHNTKMLVDSELPIFGGGKYPALTIRLSEGSGMPISVLTGVDMLLDQLIHHIKETIVVHHVEGSVQKYDVIVQNKIPYLEGSEFDPLKLKLITSNMYNFLNSNMTQQGHTYWLCRETNSDELRLYDLTTICPVQAKSRHKNPFLMPVVNLMYKIACKLINETLEYRSIKVTNVAWGLLTGADKLIENAHVPEFRACINYLLAGIYLQHHTKPNKKSKEINQEDLLKGLSEEMFKGYNKFPGIINISDLVEESGEDDTSHAPVKTVYQIPNIKLKVESATQALEYCKEALQHLEKCRHDDEEIPYVADNFDDVMAYKEHDHITGDTVFNHLRHALLIRSATCYLILATQAALLNKGFKMYKFGQAGLQCCTSVLSSLPAKAHDNAAKGLIPPLCACFIRSTLLIATTVTDVSILEQNYREKIITKIAGEHISVLEKYNFARCWLYKSKELSFSDWTAKVDYGITKFMGLLKEDYHSKRKLTYKPLVEAIFDPYDAACNIAQVASEFGGFIIRGIQIKLKDTSQDEVATLFSESGELTIKSATHFYDKSIELVELCPDTAHFNKVKAILLINSVIAKKLKIIAGKARKVGFEESNRLAEDVLTVYHRAFGYMPKDIKTSDGIDIHVRCLIEYSDTLLLHMSSWAGDLDKYYPGKRRTYFESCIRHYNVIFEDHSHVPVGCLSELAIYKTHVLYMLLKIRAEDLNLSALSEPIRSQVATKKIRKAAMEFVSFFEQCLDHIKNLVNMKIWDSAKRPEPHFCREIIPCFTSPHLTGPEKIRILKLTASWTKVLLDLISQTNSDDLKSAKEYALRGTVELKSIASGMKTAVDKTSQAKLEKIEQVFVLKSAPNDDKKLIKLIRSKLDEAISILS